MKIGNEYLTTDYEKAYRDLYEGVARLLVNYHENHKDKDSESYILLLDWDKLRRNFP